MRRVFAVIGFSFLFTCAFCALAGTDVSGTVAVAALAAFAVSLCFRCIRRVIIIPLLLCSVGVAALNTAFYTNRICEPVKRVIGREINVTAVSVDYPERTANSYLYTFKVEKSSDGLSKGTGFYIYSEAELMLEPYDAVSGSFTFDDEYIRNTFDYGQGVFMSAYIGEDEQLIIHKRESKPVGFYFLAMRQWFLDNIDDALLKDSAALTKAVLLSDRSELDNDIYSNLRSSGLVHAVSTSGMHLSIIAGAVYAFLHCFGVNQRKSSIISMIFVVWYVLLVGFYYPILRAGVMTLLALSGGLFEREADSVNSMGLSILIFTLINPFSAINCGMLLSMTATMGVVLLAKPIVDYLKERIETPYAILNKSIISIITIVLISVAASLFTLPVIWFFFGYVSLIGPLANLALIEFFSINLVFGMLLAMLGGVPLIGAALALFCDISAKVIISVSGWFAQLPFAVVSIDNRFIAVWMAATLCAAAVVLLLVNLKKLPRGFSFRCLTYISAVVLLSGIICTMALDTKKTEITVLDAGGCCAVITRGSNAIAVGLGGSADYGYENIRMIRGIRTLDLVALPSYNKVYCSDAKKIIASEKPRALLLESRNDERYEYITLLKNTKCFYADSDIVKVWDDITVRGHYKPDYPAMMVSIGETDILFAQKEALADMLSAGEFDADMLICADGLPENANQLKCEIIILCGGQNDYLPTNGKKIYSVEENGNLRLVIDSDKVYVRRG